MPQSALTRGTSAPVDFRRPNAINCPDRAAVAIWPRLQLRCAGATWGRDGANAWSTLSAKMAAVTWLAVSGDQQQVRRRRGFCCSIAHSSIGDCCKETILAIRCRRNYIMVRLMVVAVCVPIISTRQSHSGQQRAQPHVALHTAPHAHLCHQHRAVMPRW